MSKKRLIHLHSHVINNRLNRLVKECEALPTPVYKVNAVKLVLSDDVNRRMNKGEFVRHLKS